MPIGEHYNPTGLIVADMPATIPWPRTNNPDWVTANTYSIRRDQRNRFGLVIEHCIIKDHCPAEAWEWLEDYLRLTPDPLRRNIFLLENSPAWRFFRAKLKKLRAR